MISGVVQTDIVVVPKNFTVMPGNTSAGKLVGEMKDGLFVNQSFDVFHSINLASGDFSIPCEAVIVKDGVKTGRAEGITMEGNLLDLFRNVTAAGKEMETLAMPIIKNFAVACPALRVSKIKFSS